MQTGWSQTITVEESQTQASKRSLCDFVSLRNEVTKRVLVPAPQPRVYDNDIYDTPLDEMGSRDKRQRKDSNTAMLETLSHY